MSYPPKYRRFLRVRKDSHRAGFFHFTTKEVFKWQTIVIQQSISDKMVLLQKILFNLVSTNQKI